ncbi:Glyoxal oxidase [Mycena sanguinolenta]|uniref:Glyoxal oxidase n=1 Tax=Mycena sanguinolenta TaxID=230812 RepID=A0A8H6Y9T4_9AGAR|nr:Glyoxal oxidase [Mycena sanguinolenta]
MKLSVLIFLLPAPPVFAAAMAGSFEEVGNTLVSAMMMFLGNNHKVYILDKAEGNAAVVNGHSAWASVFDLDTYEATVMDVATNTFCSSGHHVPNGSFVTFGGNGAIGPGPSPPSQPNWDATYQDFDGGQSIRVLNPCTSDDDFSSPQCQWYDDPAVLSMQRRRWYSTAEALGNGTIVLIGGFINGGMVYSAECAQQQPDRRRGVDIRVLPFQRPDAAARELLGENIWIERLPARVEFGLGEYIHASQSFHQYVFPFWFSRHGSQFGPPAIWNFEDNTEIDLPDMPHGVVRVYPASGATAMLPMTPANNYSQTIIFCGGSDMAEPDWGNFAYPFINTWDYPASKDCQRITPEPADGSSPQYVQDDDMPQGRTMSQFIILPDGKLLLVNGGLNGTAGFGLNNSLTPQDQMPFGNSFASGPAPPALYDPEAPAGSRWSSAGFATSSIARLYHSSALLLPDASVLIAGSNPNLDVNTSDDVPFPTQYTAEKFYPPYFSAATRPVPSGIPSTLTYGGDPFDITIPASSYSGSGNDAANKTVVSVVRPGWTTHAMNFGQVNKIPRCVPGSLCLAKYSQFLQLRNSYTVNQDGSIVLHVAQMYPNSNLFQPGPALLFVVIDGIPSNGTHVIIGSGAVEAQPTAEDSQLPASILQSDANGSAGGSTSPSTSPSSTSHVALIAGIAGGVGVVALLAVGVGVCLSRRRRARIRARIAASTSARAAAPVAPYQQVASVNNSQVLLNENHRDERPWNKPEANAWNSSNQSFEPYYDTTT